MKNCFSKYQPNFNYTIEYKDEVICKCHTLTGKEYHEILSACRGERTLVEGKLTAKYDNFKDASMTFVRACDSWTLEDDNGNIMSITEESYSELDFTIMSLISNEIRAHESKTMLETAAKN